MKIIKDIVAFAFSKYMFWMQYNASPGVLNDTEWTPGQCDRDGNLKTNAIIQNSRQVFRDGFASSGTQPDPTAWDLTNSDHIITIGGNSSSSSYLRISLSPFSQDSEISILSKNTFKMPFRAGLGMSISQRVVGQEISWEMVGIDEDGDVESISAVADKAISGATATIASNVATFTIANHGLHGGDRICIYGCAEPRLNVGPVVVTILTADTFTVACTLANGTYSTTGGYAKWVDPVGYASNVASYLWENATATNASEVTRRNGSSYRSINQTVTTTVASQANTSPYTDAFVSAANFELYANLDEMLFRSYSSDSTSAPSLAKRTQGIPDEGIYYKMRIRAKNLKNFTVPVAKITAIAKSGTTTATVTTDVPHGLTTNDYIQIYGVRDITNFPNLTAQTVVASVIDETHFTVVMTGAVTANSAGGAVWKVHGSVLAPGVFAQNIQSISRTNNILTVVGNTTWATPLPGEYVHLYGMDGDASAYDGAYKVLRVNTSTLELESIGGDFSTINCGGALIRRTDVRIAFVRVLDYTRLVAEIVGGKGNTSDVNNSVPMSIVSSVNLSTAGTAAIDAAITGNPILSGVRASQATPSAVSADNDIQVPWVDRNGRQMIAQKAATATLSNVAGSATSVALLASNTSRLGATIYNDSSAILYVNFGATASTTAFTVKIQPDKDYVIPFGYTGAINGIWDSATGYARLTEITS